jgi:voltage-gated sodium channel
MVGVLVTHATSNRRAVLDGRPEEDISFSLVVLDVAISFVFMFELIVKIIAERFKPWLFFIGSRDSSWNRLDFVIVAASYTDLGSVALLLRMIRLFRVLKLLKGVPQLRMLVASLALSMDSIIYTCILMVSASIDSTVDPVYSHGECVD